MLKINKCINKLEAVLIIGCLFSFPIQDTLLAQNNKKAQRKPQTVQIDMVVVDEEGEPIQGASVVIGEGLLHAATDINGVYSFKAKPSAAVTVTMLGYNRYVGMVSQLLEDNEIVLEEADFLKSDDDVISLPFGTSYRRLTTDNVATLTSKDLEKYPTSDLRNALVGLLPGFMSFEKDGQPGLSAEETTGQHGISSKVNESVRGQQVVYIVDDIQIDISEMPIDPDEVESVTLIKDPVNKSLYGPLAANGVVYIKTKRGKANERRIFANVEAGIGVVDRFPEYVTGVDYAKLNNLARENSGLDPLYFDDDIAEYAKNDPYSMLHPNVNYREMLFKKTRPYQRANVSSYGGNDKVQYSSYIGYTGEGDIYKIGSKADYNRINVRSNLDVKLNDIIKMRFDFAGNLSYRRSPNYGSGLEINEFTSVIDQANKYSPIAFPIYTGTDPETGHKNYGVADGFGINPVGGLEASGKYTEINRAGIGTIALDIDFGHLIKGLKSTSYVGFNGSYLTRTGNSEKYATYKVIPDETVEEGYILDGPIQKESLTSKKSVLHKYYNVRYTAYERLTYDREFDDHLIDAGLTMYTSVLTREGYKEPVRQANGIFDLTYGFKNKYIFQGVLNYAGSNYYAPKNRYKFFPTFGAAWIVSDEKFMENIKWLDYLKLRGQVGRIGSMRYRSTYKYDTDWTSGSIGGFGYPGDDASSWMGTNTSSVSSTTYTVMGNPDLDWEYWDEFSVGAEVMLLNRRLMLDVAYYNRTEKGKIEIPSNIYPAYCGFFTTPNVNFQDTRYTGWELDLKYKDKIGDFSYSIGAMATFSGGKLLTYDEPDYPDSEKWYRSRIGQKTGGIYGLVYLGKYETDEEAANDPVKSSYSTDLKAGDLKYKDMNGDGVINDSDITYIGNSNVDLYYALNLNLAYKGFELTVVGNGVAGRENVLSNNYYRNGSGNNNYSVWVRDNIGGEYPRLTYHSVEHNFKTSSFWIRNTDFFKIQNVELAYNVPAKYCTSIGLGALRFFVRGANLLTLSGIKDTDPESMESGVEVYPLYKTFVGGLKITF